MILVTLVLRPSFPSTSCSRCFSKEPPSARTAGVRLGSPPLAPSSSRCVDPWREERLAGFGIDGVVGCSVEPGFTQGGGGRGQRNTTAKEVGGRGKAWSKRRNWIGDIGVSTILAWWMVCWRIVPFRSSGSLFRIGCNYIVSCLLIKPCPVSPQKLRTCVAWPEVAALAENVRRVTA